MGRKSPPQSVLRPKKRPESSRPKTLNQKIAWKVPRKVYNGRKRDKSASQRKHSMDSIPMTAVLSPNPSLIHSTFTPLNVLARYSEINEEELKVSIPFFFSLFRNEIPSKTREVLIKVFLLTMLRVFTQENNSERKNLFRNSTSSWKGEERKKFFYSSLYF